MKTCLFITANIIVSIFLIGHSRSHAADTDPAERFGSVPLASGRSETGATTLVLADEQSVLSQLRHERRIGGRQFGWEIRATNVGDEILLAATITLFDEYGRPAFIGNAESIQLGFGSKSLFYQVNQLKGTSRDGCTLYLPEHIYEITLPLKSK